MDFKQLQALGGIVSAALVRKEIEFTYHRPLPAEQWADPGVPEVEPEAVTECATIFVRKRNSRDFLDIAKAADSEKPFLAIFRCVCTEDGSPLFPSAEHASQLAEWLLVPILNAVNEVNRFDPKALPPRTTSGSTSPSRSADAASRSGRSRSPRKKGRVG